VNTYRLTITVEIPEDDVDAEEPAVYDLASKLEIATCTWWSEFNKKDDSEIDISEVRIEQQTITWSELP
jgi:uncharacterized membrane-anchored protein